MRKEWFQGQFRITRFDSATHTTTLDTVTFTDERYLREMIPIKYSSNQTHFSSNFSTGKQLRAFILHQRRTTLLCLFTISLGLLFHALHFKKSPEENPARLNNFPLPHFRVFVRSKHNTFNSTLPSVFRSFGLPPTLATTTMTTCLTVKYIFVMEVRLSSGPQRTDKSATTWEERLRGRKNAIQTAFVILPWWWGFLQLFLGPSGE